MIGYAAAEIFTPEDFRLLKRATLIVSRLPAQIDGDWVRCHELARVVGKLLDLQAFDGKYGAVEHSWLLTPSRNVLDPYVPARVPQVQLVDAKVSCLANAEYRTGPDREDIRRDVIQALHRMLGDKTARAEA